MEHVGTGFFVPTALERVKPVKSANAASTGRFRPMLEPLEQLERILCPGKNFHEMRVKIDLKPVKSIRDLQEDTSLGWKRRIGQLYFQVLEDGQVIPRVITTATNGDWITKMIREGKLYIPNGGSVCEKS